MSVEFHIVIPARYSSTRLPGKLLKDIGEIPVLERTWLQAKKAKPQSVIIATDHLLIAESARAFGAEVCLTDATHSSGTDRVSEVVRKGGYEANSIIVNVQGDEPFISPLMIEQVASALDAVTAPVSTLIWPIKTKKELLNPNLVKVVYNQKGKALYFSRSPIPAHRDFNESVSDSWRHIGLYAYRVDFLQQWPSLPTCSIETHEQLEQLRILWAGYDIFVTPSVVAPLQDINTQEDLDSARLLSIVE